MNVILLFIEVQKTKNASSSIKDLIIDDFKKASSDPSLYLSKIKEEWNIQKNNLKSLYSLKYLVVYQNRNNNRYFIFDSSQTGISNKNKTTLDLLILSDIENIDHSINTVVNDIKGILRNREVKVLKENNIFLFPHNTATDDIYDPNIKIKAVFNRKSLSMWEWIRIAFIGVISIVLTIIHFFGHFTQDLIAIFISLYTAGYFFLISELFIKILPSLNISPFNKKLNISIGELSSCIRHHNTMPFSEPEELRLQSPQEDETP